MTTQNPTMIYEQQKRYDKIFTEPLYLLNFANDTFSISGSTKSVYTVKWYEETEGKYGSFFCNCPDMKNHARKNNVYCKHICFIYKKIGRFDRLGFYQDKVLTEQETSVLVDRLNTLAGGLCDTSIQNKALIDKYNAMLTGNVVDMFKTNALNKEIEGECPICFDEFAAENILFCPTCGNMMHKECMLKWLESHDSCVYCRSDVWKTYNGPTQKSGQYIQL